MLAQVSRTASWRARNRGRGKAAGQRYGGPVEGLASCWTDVEGLRLHSRRSAGDGPTAVLVHGISVSSRYMVPLARELAPDHDVHAVDLPGFGRSAKPRRTLGVADLARSLAAWLAAEGLERPLLVANSFGCQVAVDLLSRDGERARALVLVGPTVDANARSWPRQTLRWARSAFHERPTLPFVVARDLLASGPMRTIRTADLALDDPVEEKADRTDVPTLVVRGENDPIAQQAWCEDLAARFRRGRLVIVPRGGHALNYSRPRDLGRIVRSFESELA